MLEGILRGEITNKKHKNKALNRPKIGATMRRQRTALLGLNWYYAH